MITAFRHRPLPSTRRRRRAVLYVAAVGLIALTASAAWLALSLRHASDSGAAAARLDDSYQRGRLALARLSLRESTVLRTGSPGSVAALAPAVARLQNSVDEIARNGSAVDRAAAVNVQSKLQSLQRQLGLMTTAVNKHDFAGANDAWIVANQLQNGMAVQIANASAGHRARSVAAFDTARRSETIVFAEVVIAGVLSVLLLVAGARIVRYKASLDEAQAAELNRLRDAALTDSLTRLPNHRAFHEQLERQLQTTSVALVAVDLDGLKQVNDRAGHQAGDEVIRALADGLRRTLRVGHSAFRIGGDEFAVIIPCGTAMEGFYLAQNLRQELRSPVAGAPVVEATAGVAEARLRSNKDVVIRHADLALIEAKRAHRGALVYSADLELVLAADEVAAQHHVATLASALARAVDAKDAYTHSHCETVAELCALMAIDLGLSPESVAQVRLAGLLHDVGKIGISDAILKKPGRLTEEEYRTMQTHPALGAHIVSAAELDDEATWILHHHERLDGGGYPDGLAGHDVPLESRIIMVADAFEAITADRPYRDSRSAEEALEELNRHAGTQFDPVCLRALEHTVAGGIPRVQVPESVRLAA